MLSFETGMLDGFVYNYLVHTLRCGLFMKTYIRTEEITRFLTCFFNNAFIILLLLDVDVTTVLIFNVFFPPQQSFNI